jgi:hypothetical protein
LPKNFLFHWLESTDCLARRIESLHLSNYLEAAWVDVVDTHDKDGLCKRAAVFKIRQQCQLLCQAYIFALARMNLQSDYDVPNKTSSLPGGTVVKRPASL